jgi:NTE family protein
VLYADLVLEGGGVKGIALVGAISVLEERGYEFKRIAGTSAGSVVGALVAAGIKAGELERIMREVDYLKFQDGGLPERLLVGKIASLLARCGIYRGDYLRTWLDGILEGKEKRTFADMPYEDDADHPVPEEKRSRLVVMTSDLSEGCLRRLPWDYDRYGLDRAGQKVADAVRASMSIPFFFRPVRLPVAGGSKAWLVDGGMLSNFPIDVFDSPTTPRWPTFGIKLSAQPDAAQGLVNRIKGPVSMTRAMVDTATGFYDRMHVDSSDAVDRTIFIDTGKISATNFGLSPEDRDQLYENGRRAAVKFLDGGDGRPAWDFDAYIAKHRTPAPATPAAPTPRPAAETGTTVKQD